MLFPPRGCSPPPWYDKDLTEKEKRERPEACKHRFESYDEAWERFYKLGLMLEMNASKLLDLAVKKATEVADNEPSKKFEGDVPRHIKNVRIIFSEQTEDAQAAMDGVVRMRDLQRQHQMRGLALHRFLKQVAQGMCDCMTVRLQQQCEFGDKPKYNELLSKAWRGKVPDEESSTFHQSFRKTIYANFWYAHASNNKVENNKRGSATPRRERQATYVSPPPGLGSSDESSSDEFSESSQRGTTRLLLLEPRLLLAQGASSSSGAWPHAASSAWPHGASPAWPHARYEDGDWQYDYDGASSPWTHAHYGYGHWSAGY